MKNRKKLIAIVIVLMIVGFATVATTLFLNGSTFIAGDQDEFDQNVIFIEAKNEDGDDFPISGDGKTITFTSKELASLNEVDKLLFKVKNKSTQYGANVTIDCATNEGEDDTLVTFGAFFKGETVDTHETFIDRQGVKDGYLNVTLIKNVTEPIDVQFTCTLDASPVESEGEIEYDPTADMETYVLKTMSSSDADALIEKNIVNRRIINSNTAPENAVASYLLGTENDEDIIGYLVKIGEQDPSEYDPDDIESGYDPNLYEYDLVSTGKIKVLDASGLFQNSTVTSESGLEYLDLSENTSMNGMFYGATIDGVNLAKLNTSNVEQMNSTFFGATLKNVDLSNWDTSSVVELNSAFQNATLENVNLSNWNLNNVSGAYTLFEYAILNNVNISNWSINGLSSLSRAFAYTVFDDLTINFQNTSNLTNTERLFAGSTGNIIDISGLNTSNVTNMSGLFDGATINEVVIGEMNTSNLRDASGMFRSFKTTKKLDVTGMDVSNVTSASQMFYGVETPELDMSGLEFTNLSSLSSFLGGAKIKSINMSNVKMDNVYSMEAAFSWMTDVETINMENFSATGSRYFNGWLKENPTLKTVNLKNANIPNATLFSEMFKNDSELINLDLSGITASKVTNLYYMFSGCRSITKIDLTDFDLTNTDSVNTIGMFMGTTALTEVKVTNKFNATMADNTFTNSGISQLTIV